jgi:hypothetical protein
MICPSRKKSMQINCKSAEDSLATFVDSITVSENQFNFFIPVTNTIRNLIYNDMRTCLIQG